MTAFYPYSVSTGPYTVDQIEGEACARCGQPFVVGSKSRPSIVFAGFQLFAHVLCLTKAATR